MRRSGGAEDGACAARSEVSVFENGVAIDCAPTAQTSTTPTNIADAPRVWRLLFGLQRHGLVQPELEDRFRGNLDITSSREHLHGPMVAIRASIANDGGDT